MKLLIATLLLAAASAAPMQQSLSVHDDGSYQFFYETGKDGGQHSRTEVRHPDGVVVGKYSYEDANGALREVRYRADDQGYVEGDPKAVPVEEEVQSPPPAAVDEDPEPQESAAVESTIDEEPPKQDEPKEELSLEEQPPSANDPPEAFPPGFFLQNFHGLRRLPEPTTTNEDKPTAEEPTTEEPKADEDVKDNETGTEEEPPKQEEGKEGQPLNEMDAFTHLRPFRSFAPQPMDTSMFRPPVYVFSYQHPDSYGYHYFF